MLPLYETIKKPKFMLKGVATYLPTSLSKFLPQHGKQFKGEGVRAGFDADNMARACYTLWLRFLVTLGKNAELKLPIDKVAEVGPGDSLGLGIAALISGSSHYYALDAVKTALAHDNLKVFDALVSLFRSRAPIPNDEAFPKAYPKLASYDFPHHIFTDSLLETALNETRLANIRSMLEKLSQDNNLLYLERGGLSISYLVPWTKRTELKKTFDLIVSNATMEHVDNLEEAYQKMGEFTKKGGYFVHAIDYKSHATAGLWNGHWTYSKPVWRVIRGNSKYLINRAPHSLHLRLAEKNGFKIVSNQPYYAPTRLELSDLSKEFRFFKADDLKTSVGVIMGQRIM